MEIIKDTVNMCNVKAKGVTQAMADGDVIVPDSKPDILKLLQVDSDAVVTDKYIENGRLVINGRVNFKVLYVPDSEGEKIKSINTSMEFRQVVDSSGADNNVKLFVKPSVLKVEFNTVNSRKLRLRAIVHIEYEINELNELEICTDIVDDTIEKDFCELQLEDTVDISEHSFTVKEMLEIPSGSESVKEILKMDVKVFDTEYKPVTGKVIVKGTVGVCILYTDTLDNVKFIEAEIPFTEILDTDGVSEDTLCEIDYTVIGDLCTLEADGDGDMRCISVDVDVCASLKGVEMRDKGVLRDCFVPYMETDLEKQEIPITITCERPTIENTVREVVSIPENIPAVSGVYNVMCTPAITKSELQKNKILCEGKLDTYILYLTDTTENPIYSHRKEISFSYMLDCNNDTTGLRCEIKPEVRHVSYNLNSKGEVEIRCVLSVESVLIKEDKISNIEGINTHMKDMDDGIVICFAEAGEDVWDIAKRYGVPKEKLIYHNNIEDTRLSEKTRLFIPSN